MTYLPMFRGQLTSGDPYGGVDCTAWSASFAIDYATSGQSHPTGTMIRHQSNEPVPDPRSPGLNLAQVDDVGNDHYGVDIEVHYRYPFDDFADRAEKEGYHLQGAYAPIADSKYDAGRGFRTNHDVFGAPGFVIYDPLADGRVAGVYRFRGDPYPKDLLRRYAGRLNVGGDTYRELGLGFVYCAFVSQKGTGWEAHVGPGVQYTRYQVEGSPRRIKADNNYVAQSGFTAPCTSPKEVIRKSGTGSVWLVKITKPGSYLDGKWIAAKRARRV